MQPSWSCVLEDGSSVTIQKIVRTARGYFSGMATCRGQVVWVRGFRSRRRAARELRGREWLHECGMLTPNHHASHRKDGWTIHVYEYCTDARSLVDVLNPPRHINPSEKTAILKTLMVEFATHHVFGVMQRAPHPRDFLQRGGKWMLTHGDNIIRKNMLLPKKESLKRLAQFFSIMGYCRVEEFRVLVNEYANARGLRIKESDLKWMARVIWIRKILFKN